MLVPSLRAPARVLRRPVASSTKSSNAFNVSKPPAINPCPCQSPFLWQVRHATHGAQGRANGPKNGPGKRLGAKKTGDEYVIPGNIIFRQRGTNWHPGHNVGMGRDHTLYAEESGFVKYYRDPSRHSKRRYIGVVFERHESLPVNPAAPRKRRLGMLAVPRPRPVEDPLGMSASGVAAFGDSSASVAKPPLPNVEALSRLSPSKRREARRKMATGRLPSENLRMGSDYSYRESNYDIGRTADRAGVKVKEFIPGDRFRAWRKTKIRRKRRAEKNVIGRKKPSARKVKRN